MLVIAAGLILIAGVLIGAVGIGGVLVVPALTDAAGLAIERAIAASMFGFLLTGMLAVVLQWRTLRAASGAWLLNLAALIGAVSGALVLDLIPDLGIRLFIAVLAIVSGEHALVGRTCAQAEPSPLSRIAVSIIGFIVGCGSALSGTGGPVMLMPILMALRVPIVDAIAMSQLIQVPIALSATGVNAAHGRIDLLVALAVGALLVMGALAGSRITSRVDPVLLKRIVAQGLVVLGIWYAYSTL